MSLCLFEELYWSGSIEPGLSLGIDRFPARIEGDLIEVSVLTGTGRAIILGLGSSGGGPCPSKVD